MYKLIIFLLQFVMDVKSKEGIPPLSDESFEDLFLKAIIEYYKYVAGDKFISASTGPHCLRIALTRGAFAKGQTYSEEQKLNVARTILKILCGFSMNYKEKEEEGAISFLKESKKEFDEEFKKSKTLFFDPKMVVPSVAYFLAGEVDRTQERISDLSITQEDVESDYFTTLSTEINVAQAMRELEINLKDLMTKAISSMSNTNNSPTIITMNFDEETISKLNPVGQSKK